jgi:FkbM family methyltransferase
MKRFTEKWLSKLLRKAEPAYHSARASWSQQGEDMIIDFVFKWQLGQSLPSYLDIGANHPYLLSNTYFFYKKGCTGVNIEPDPDLMEGIKTCRPNDINLNVGVGEKSAVLDFYCMSQSTLNTFSKTTADAYQASKTFGNPTIKSVKKIDVITANEVLEKYFIEKEMYFISIDVEGLDEEIVRSIDYDKYKPTLLCVETLLRTKDGGLVKQDGITTHLESQGYFVYADTGVNTIYIRKEHYTSV